MLVGEQPGDREDLEGEPFVGPAGAVLARALESARIDPGDVYLTNAVKHFKWRARGKRRLHQTPRAGEVEACKPWLEAELEAVRPTGLLALGSTAAKALFGSSVRVTRDRGSSVESDLAPYATATVHPSSLLRIDDAEERRIAEAELAADLARAAAKLDRRTSSRRQSSRSRARRSSPSPLPSRCPEPTPDPASLIRFPDPSACRSRTPDPVPDPMPGPERAPEPVSGAGLGTTRSSRRARASSPAGRAPWSRAVGPGSPRARAAAPSPRSRSARHRR